MTMGERIRYARKYRGYTQKQLAEMIGAKHNSVSGWEKDKHKPDIDSIFSICSVLNINTTWMLGTSNTMIDNEDDLHITDVKFHEDTVTEQMISHILEIRHINSETQEIVNAYVKLSVPEKNMVRKSLGLALLDEKGDAEYTISEEIGNTAS